MSYFPRLRYHLRRFRGFSPFVRETLAAQYLKGDGIEIGALHQPLLVPRRACVRYVDRMGLAELRQHYPELRKLPLVAPDVIDDGEKLTTFSDASVDFIIANHFLEHCLDPIGTLKRFLQVVRPNGFLYLAVPDKRLTFDHQRPLTTWEHLIADYADGGIGSRMNHYEEWAALVDGSRSAQQWAATDHSIHFHTWTNATFLAFVTSLQQQLQMPFEVMAYFPHTMELILLLRRIEATANSDEHRVSIATAE